jgi:hypothetical protein
VLDGLMEEARIEDEYFLQKERSKLRSPSKLDLSRSNISWSINSTK